MRLTLLGTGNAAGVPLYGCQCPRCIVTASQPDKQRKPACAVIEFKNTTFLIDAGLMNISERYPAGSLNGIFLTHFHPDHVQGLFHLRWGMGNRIPVYCPPDSSGCADLFKNPGLLDFHTQKKFVPFTIDTVQITPLPLIHSKVTFGYLFEHQHQRIAYLTDTKGLPPQTLSFLEQKPLDLLVIDTCYPAGVDGYGHNNLDDAQMIHQQLNVRKTVLTHIGHDLDVWLSDPVNTLAESIIAGHDDMLAWPD
ncbi:MAG: phosphonate metabolism protein PhnP [Gammaproteobacteria bacterium]|nr:phosphonate metabolism protein PhnP [Gammaproteobacteria bacterium]